MRLRLGGSFQQIQFRAKQRSDDCAGPDQQFEAIYQAFVDHSVITIRGQNIAPEDHLTFARRFGTINVNRFFKKLDTHPEIAIVLKEKDQKKAIGERWHTDHSYDQMPAMGSAKQSPNISWQ